MDLQKGPLGLLSWFNLKTTGRNPRQFGEVVTPIVDVGELYLTLGEFATPATVVGSIAIGAGSQSAAIFTVPAGKLWRLVDVSCDITLDAADAAFRTSWYAYVTLTGGSGTNFYLTAGELFVPGNTVRFGAYFLPKTLWLPSGAVIGIALQTSAACTVAAQTHAYVSRYQIDS